MYIKWLQIGGSGRGDPVLDELYTHPDRCHAGRPSIKFVVGRTGRCSNYDNKGVF